MAGMIAPTGETVERSAVEDAPSPKVQQTMIRNSDAPQVDDQAALPRGPIRVVWPVPVTETPTKVTKVSEVVNETAGAVSPERDVRMAGDTANALRPREQITGSLRIVPVAVLLFISLGLPGAGILAWLVIKADTARGEQIARNHFRLRGTNSFACNKKRLVDGFDDQREADWIDHFIANVVRAPATSLRNAARTSVGPVGKSPDAIEAALRDIMLTFRHRAAARYDFSSDALLPGA